MYFITGFTKYEIDEKTKVPNVGFSRTFGYYERSDEAIEAVLGNYCDIFECCYTYMVVEEIEPGLYNPASYRWFFKWNDESKKYEFIKPFEDCWGNYAFG